MCVSLSTCEKCVLCVHVQACMHVCVCLSQLGSKRMKERLVVTYHSLCALKLYSITDFFYSEISI